MPILVDYNPGNGGDLLNLAQQAGTVQGQAQRRSQQVGIDAGVQRQAIAAAQERNSEPGFYERVSQGAAAEGRYAQARQDDLDAQEAARNAAEAAVQRQESQRAAAQAQDSQQREQHARLLEDFQRGGQTPEAASTYVAEATRRGIKPDARIAAAAGPLTPGEQTARDRATATGEAAGSKEDLARERLQETERANRAREQIQQQRIKGAGALSATEERLQQQVRQKIEDEQMTGYGYDAGTTVGMIVPDPKTGLPPGTAHAAYRGILSENKSPGEILARVKELEDAGLPPQIAAQMRAKVADRQVKMEQQRQQFLQIGKQAEDVISKLPSNIPIEQALKQHGLSPQDYERYLQEVEAQMGLSPASPR